MSNYTLDLFHLFPVICYGYLMSVSLFYILIPISIFGALIAIYFLVDKSKENFAFKCEALMKKINQLDDENKNLAEELTDLKTKLEVSEKQKEEWNREKQSLIQIIEELENQITKLKKSETAEKEDIIIEYYVNEKSSDK
jgi:septal ring factor EnvC (AmiA/AmiB activator)